VSRCHNEQIRALYDRYAKPIDALLGRATENSPYRKKAVARLDLTSSSSVLDAACGTGSNFKIIESYLQNHGTLVGIDISSKSLETAARLVAERKWKNVRLLNASIVDYKPATRFDAILCTFALEIATEYEKAVDNLLHLLKPNGRFAILGIKKSSAATYRGLNPFVKRALQKACIDLDRDLPKYLKPRAKMLSYEECFLGFYYIVSASSPEIPFNISN
jgi:ubiquinone/menaquinone biosynthesis C-methylase UbiE